SLFCFAPSPMRSFLARLGVAVVTLPFVALGIAALIAASSTPPLERGKVRLVVWGLPSGEETKGLNAQLREFERRYPGIHVVNMGAGSMALHSQKLLSSIVGNVAPDAARHARFPMCARSSQP